MKYLKYFENNDINIEQDLNQCVMDNELDNLKMLYKHGADLNRIEIRSLIYALKFSLTDMSNFLIQNCKKFRDLNMKDLMKHVNDIPDDVLTNDSGECLVSFDFKYDQEEIANELGIECMVTDDLIEDEEDEDNNFDEIDAIFFNLEHMGNYLYIYCFFKDKNDMGKFMKKSKEVSPLNEFDKINNIENYSDVDLEFIKKDFKFSCVFNCLD